MTINNPKVVIEVLSPSTEVYDRGNKFTFCRNLESLEEYVLVSQTAPLVEGFLRQPGGTWSVAFYSGTDTGAQIRSLSIELPLAHVYAGIEWPVEEEPGPPDATP